METMTFLWTAGASVAVAATSMICWSFAKRPTPSGADDAVGYVSVLVWGEYMHYAPAISGMSYGDAARIHEERVADLIRARPGHTVLDVGCGVGAPMRAVARKSGCKVVGINISEYQVTDARARNKAAGLGSACEVVVGDFLRMPFDDGSFDGAYSIEATCHAESLEEVYAEIFRVLKPGGMYVSYELVTTELYRPGEYPEQEETVSGIERLCRLPGLRRHDEVGRIAREVGFEVVEERDLARPPAGPWWARLREEGGITYWKHWLLLSVSMLLGIAPRGSLEVLAHLREMGIYQCKGAETGICTTMYMILCKKPLENE